MSRSSSYSTFRYASSFSLLVRPMASETGTHWLKGAAPAATFTSVSMAERRLS